MDGIIIYNIINHTHRGIWFPNPSPPYPYPPTHLTIHHLPSTYIHRSYYLYPTTNGYKRL